MSSWNVARSPEMYGGKQKAYEAETQGIIAKTAAEFRSAVDRGEDLILLFHSTLKALGDARGRIAREAGTKNAEQFGSRRDESVNCRAKVVMTELDAQYKAYNNSLLPLFQKTLGSMKHTHQTLEETEKDLFLESVWGKKAKVNFSISSNEERKWHILLDLAKYNEIAKILGEKEHSSGSGATAPLANLLCNRALMQKLKTVAPSTYKALKCRLVIKEICIAYPYFCKSDWVLVTLRLEVDQKFYALSSYITWMYRTLQDDPVKYMTNRSVISIMHTDVFLIEPLLNEIAQIFKRALETDSKDLPKLKEHVAHFEYLFAHTMPFERGSAAISEWFELALYRFHGYTLTYTPDKNVNLEALTSWPKTFLDNYDSMISLKAVE